MHRGSEEKGIGRMSPPRTGRSDTSDNSGTHTRASRASRTSRGSKKSVNMMDNLTGNPAKTQTLTEMYGDHLSQLDPIKKGKTWFSTYQQGKKDVVNSKLQDKEYRKYRNSQKDEAESVIETMDAFETKLRTLKRF